MAPVAETVSALCGGIVLWIVGMHVFDCVHWLLHCLLRSRFAALRWLAMPHAWHHAFLDTQLRIQPAWQRRNFIGHLIPEYLTQLAASALASVVLPLSWVLVCVALQTMMFAFLASQKGLDINHRAVDRLDAYTPSFFAPPAYHALHHVYPDAHFGAYSKLVDLAVGGGIWLAGKRVGVAGQRSVFLEALGRELEAAGTSEPIPIADLGDPELARLDILLVDGTPSTRERYCEAYIQATRERQLPPEVWACQPRAVDGLALHYFRDVRVSWRALVVPDGGMADGETATAAARCAFSRIRRGLHFVSVRPWRDAWQEFRAFRAAEPHPPVAAERVRHRREFA